MNNIILVGNPNTGKTTLFNTLTKSNNHVGNWHGVTVDVSEKLADIRGEKCKICDLPGIYSLNSYTPEEEVAIKYLNAHKGDLIVNICDANNLQRNLQLTLQLLEMGHRIVVAVNMANEVKNINYSKLASTLKVPVIPIDARKKKSVAGLLESLNNIQHQQVYLPYINKLTGKIEEDILSRYSFIDKIVSEVITSELKTYGTSRIDKVLYNKFLAVPIFLLVMLTVFIITFGAIGQNFSILIEGWFAKLVDVVSDFLIKLNISPWAYSLLVQGVIGGMGSVVSFLPQIVLLFMCMNFLEDLGYLSRVAFMFDNSLKKIGLTGKSVFSLVLGFGCTTTAMLTTTGLDKRTQKRTAMLLPFASCSAKLPVYALICAAFFAKNKVLVVFSLYLFGVILGLIITAITNKLSKQKSSPFIMEIPPIRVPTLSKTLKNAKTNAFNFVKRVGGTLVVCSVVVWVLSNLTFGFKYTVNPEESILCGLAKYIAVLFKPLGFGNTWAVVALLVGIVAKEMVVSCLSIANGVGASLEALAASLTLTTSAVSFTTAGAISFLVFILLYSPCVSALSVTAREVSRKFAVFSFVFQFVIAYGCSFVIYNLISAFYAKQIIEALITIIVLAVCIVFVVRYFKQKNKCIACKGSYCEKNCLQK